MTIVTIAIVTVVVVGGVLAAALLYRLSVLRSAGTAVTVRILPAADARAWRHSVMRYGEEKLVFFKLTSLRPGPDIQLARQNIAIAARRGPTELELDIMAADTRILALDADGVAYEIAVDEGTFTAFTSWVESRPSGRYRRGQP